MLRELAETTIESASEVESAVEQHCSTIAQLTIDAYYMVVISKFGGSRIIGHIMKLFRENATIQESCCFIFQKMAHNSHVQEFGVDLILDAMEFHPGSVYVQSAGCEALSEILKGSNASSNDIKIQEERLKQLVGQASEMYLTPAARQSATFLLVRLHAMDISR